MKRFLIFSMIGFGLLCVLLEITNAQQKKVRAAVVAGQFYPSAKAELVKQLQDDLAQAQKIELDGTLHALVAPHAGYLYYITEDHLIERDHRDDESTENKTEQKITSQDRRSQRIISSPITEEKKRTEQTMRGTRTRACTWCAVSRREE
jgi:excinuclease UvrABC ATPase subunit